MPGPDEIKEENRRFRERIVSEVVGRTITEVVGEVRYGGFAGEFTGELVLKLDNDKRIILYPTGYECEGIGVEVG